MAASDLAAAARAAIAVLASLGLGAGAGPGRAADPEPPPGPQRAVLDADGVQRIRIVGGDYFFRPNHIVVKARAPVELTVNKEPGIVPHSLVIEAPDQGVAVDLALDAAPKSVRFVPAAPGRFAFYCKERLLFFKSHREKGMEGVIEAVE
ncbi:MAG: quinol oxidase [Betaproteobacteria bacterium]|nr:quinol oxidase [Betaproteobacteria bacterium]